MNVLIVCSGNKGYKSPFVKEQSDGLIKFNIDIKYFLIKGKGVIGYLKNYKLMNETLKEFRPDIIHAHYGLSGMLALLQFKKPLIVTLHGSDIHYVKNNIISSIVSVFVDYTIFVSKKLSRNIFLMPRNKQVIPCAVDTDTFVPIEKKESKLKLNFDIEKKYILFSSSFSNKIKNYELAKKAIGLIDSDVSLIELVNKSREEVNYLLNACELLLLTSFAEGSPQIIKEALACNRPIVSTDVGDVSDVIDGVNGCYLTTFELSDVARKLESALEFSEKNHYTKGRDRIFELGLDTNTITKKIIAIYENISRNKKIIVKN